MRLLVLCVLASSLAAPCVAQLAFTSSDYFVSAEANAGSTNNSQSASSTSFSSLEIQLASAFASEPQASSAAGAVAQWEVEPDVAVFLVRAQTFSDVEASTADATALATLTTNFEVTSAFVGQISFSAPGAGRGSKFERWDGTDWIEFAWDTSGDWTGLLTAGSYRYRGNASAYSSGSSSDDVSSSASLTAVPEPASLAALALGGLALLRRRR